MPAALNGCLMTLKSFTNAGITPVHDDKPHLVFIDGYWRVSKMPRRGWMNPLVAKKFMQAHAYATDQNNELVIKGMMNACYQ